MFSVITPSFNQGRFIERTIQSVLSQNMECFEYFVVDGGSTDETVSILKKYEPKLRWISEKDKGQSHAVNKGICATSGEIICWLNSDDIYYPQTFQKVHRFFQLHPEVDILYGNANNIDENDSNIEAYPTKNWNLKWLKKTCFLCQPAVFFRRCIIERFGFLDEDLKYCMDYEYWLRLAYAGVKFAYLPKTLSASRVYSQTKTLGFRLDFHKEINNMMLKRFGRVPDRWLYNYVLVLFERKKMDRSNLLLVALSMISKSCFYALRWNRKVSFTMLSSSCKLFCKMLKEVFEKGTAI